MDRFACNGCRAVSRQFAHQVHGPCDRIAADGGFVPAIAGSGFSVAGWNAGRCNPEEHPVDRACAHADGDRRHDDGNAIKRIHWADGGKGQLSASADEAIVWVHRRHWLRHDGLLDGRIVPAGARLVDATEERRLKCCPFVWSTSNANTQKVCALVHRQSQPGSNHVEFQSLIRLGQQGELFGFG